MTLDPLLSAGCPLHDGSIVRKPTVSREYPHLTPGDTMARVLVLYATPPDPVAFDQHYADVHIPLVHALPGLQKFDLATGTILSHRI